MYDDLNKMTEAIKCISEEFFEKLSEALNALTATWESLAEIEDQIYNLEEPDYDRIPPRVLPGEAAHRVSFRAPASAAFRHWRCSVYGKH